LLRPRNPHQSAGHSPLRNRPVLNFQIWRTSRISCRIPAADARFHSTPHVHFSQIHASFDLGGRKLQSGIKSGAAAESDSNQSAIRLGSVLVRDRLKFGGRWELPRSCSKALGVRWEPPRPCLGAVAVRWEPPHSCGGGALQRSETTSPLKKRFSAGHFAGNPSSASIINIPIISTNAEAPTSRNLELWIAKIRNRHLRNLFRLERTPILCFVRVTRRFN